MDALELIASYLREEGFDVQCANGAASVFFRHNNGYTSMSIAVYGVRLILINGEYDLHDPDSIQKLLKDLKNYKRQYE